MSRLRYYPAIVHFEIPFITGTRAYSYRGAVKRLYEEYKDYGGVKITVRAGFAYKPITNYKEKGLHL